VDAYLFASVNRNENKLTVCGWLPKALFLERANLFVKGIDRKREDGSTFKTKSDMYEIGNYDLFYEATSWEKLFTTIKHFAENRDHPKYQTMKQWLADYEKEEK
jgi:bacterioferritin (cytochrome b1)